MPRLPRTASRTFRSARPTQLAASAAALLFSSAAVAQITPTFNDVTYATAPLDAGGSIPLRMDLYLPAIGTPPYPLVIWIHGGGWFSGNYEPLASFASPMLLQGVAIAAVEYRLSGEAIFPAQIHDIKAAVRFLRANAAAYALNPRRFSAWGTSAGAHLTALLATSAGVADAEGAIGGNALYSSAIQAGVDYFGPTDILNMQLDVTTPPGSAFNHDLPSSPESRLIGFDAIGQGIGVLRANQNNPNPPFPQKVALVRLANPITHVDAFDPPMFIAHGMIDTTVPLKQSTRLRDALAGVGVTHTYLEVAGAGHGALGNDIDSQARAFLLNRLTSPPSLAGDLDCDGTVDTADITPFTLAMTSPAAYRTSLPGCDLLNADMNGDGYADGRDIAAFVDAIIGGT